MNIRHNTYPMYILSFIFILISSNNVSGYYITTDRINYTNDDIVNITFFTENSISGGSLYLEHDGEIYQSYSGSSQGYISGYGSITYPFYPYQHFNSCSGYYFFGYNCSQSFSFNWTISMYNESYIFINSTNITFNFTLIPTPSPTPYPNISGNYSNFSYDTTGSFVYINYANSIVNSINSTIQDAFGIISLPLTYINDSVYTINASLSSYNYTQSMSILTIILPAFNDALPSKFKAVVAYGLILMAILIILGRD